MSRLELRLIETIHSTIDGIHSTLDTMKGTLGALRGRLTDVEDNLYQSDMLNLNSFAALTAMIREVGETCDARAQRKRRRRG
ncbi:MAG: hypothetical protein FJX76_18240 [Armatimonadetes bacterium]|nr:hypothetical protein [Armatimonadota bacterium]